MHEPVRRVDLEHLAIHPDARAIRGVPVVIGDRERIYDPHKALERTARLVPGIETDLVPGGGHILAMQLPDVVGERVLAFL
jgi:pimeloyl-ACP methyl ester carboxylesterase